MVPAHYVGPHYSAWVYPPDEVARVEYTHVVRPSSRGREVQVDERMLHTQGAQEQWHILRD
jgi:hypothetical protein